MYSNHWIGGWVLFRAFFGSGGGYKSYFWCQELNPDHPIKSPVLPVLGAEKLFLLDVESLQLYGS
jgi:hypothetical protein